MPSTQTISVRIAAAAIVATAALLGGAGTAAAAELDRPAEPAFVAPNPKTLLHQFITGIIGESTGSQCSFDTRPDCGK
ncbi:hypothetical protein F5X71_12090 [Nocardia brasiliensis]|uniref:Uncharacterized protein n=1 Tax=Nocardia brasiliensis TaxID=37326 RepID=A0A6G9XQ44_NOCBR|nr:hypothetical protein [Nocardia brasiliensis]QIS02953.1 hypothetical protein F5X71_12090 [Nocardia brasiliensis]